MTNYSLVPQEMLACGLPCVELDRPSTRSVFGADGPVTLADFDADAIADGLERLLDDEAEWERRSRLGRDVRARPQLGRAPPSRSSASCATRSRVRGG